MFTSGRPDVDVDGDGVLDAVALDLDADGLRDDVLTDVDGDGLADHAVLDVEAAESWFTDDGSGTWAVPADVGGGRSGPLRWLSLDGLESSGGPTIDFDADGVVDDLLVDGNGDGVADRVLSDDHRTGYVDTDGDGHWDVKLTDTDADGTADAASLL